MSSCAGIARTAHAAEAAWRRQLLKLATALVFILALTLAACIFTRLIRERLNTIGEDDGYDEGQLWSLAGWQTPAARKTDNPLESGHR